MNNLHKLVTPPKGSVGIRKQLSDADLRKAAHRAELSHQLHGNGDPIARDRVDLGEVAHGLDVLDGVRDMMTSPPI